MCTGIHARMAGARYSSDVLQMFFGPIPEEENRNLPQLLQPNVVVYFDVFTLARSNLEEWFRVWRMAVSEKNADSKDLLAFARETKAEFTDCMEKEIKELKSVKVRFGLKVKFLIETV